MADPVPTIEPLPPMGNSLDSFVEAVVRVTRSLAESLGLPAAVLEIASQEATYTSTGMALRQFQFSEFPTRPIPANPGAIQAPDPPRNPNAKSARR